MTLLAPGRCRHCGCGGESCRLPDGDLCAFTDPERMVCSAKPCQIAEAARKARAASERKAAEESSSPRLQREAWRKAYIALSRQGLGHDLIVEILTRRRDRAKRRKGKAA